MILLFEMDGARLLLKGGVVNYALLMVYVQ